MAASQNLTSEEVAALDDLKTTLTQRLGGMLERVVLFGSKSRGDHDEDSDLDVAIIVRGLDPALKREIFDLVGGIEVEHDVPISCWVTSLEHFADLHARERRIALDVEREGVPL